MIEIIVADDHQIVIDGIKLMFKEDDDISIIGEANDGMQLIRLLEKENPHMVLLDINMPNLDGIETCNTIRKLYPRIKVIALSMFSEITYIEAMIKNGASAYLLKNSGMDEIKQAVIEVHRGEQYFSKDVLNAMVNNLKGINQMSKSHKPIPKISKREKQILELILQENTSQEIADQLFISFWTVESHRRNLMKKLKAKNTVGLVKKALEFGLVD